ncbi:MAG: hypothetical protein JWP12_1647 [Bacteroidetes bacterium]|nr:hypothetical protein [Bacteroidota bacterium]
MKKIATILSFLIIGIATTTNAQTAPKKEEETNCYLKWAQKFEERGAEDIADGTYTDVIISFRNGGDAECFNGKVDVKGGKVMAMYLKKEDGSFEIVTKKSKYDKVPVTITNGMSSTIVTKDDELINVLFVKKIKPKKAGFEKAADPTDD